VWGIEFGDGTDVGFVGLRGQDLLEFARMVSHVERWPVLDGSRWVVAFKLDVGFRV
jgi:hypothetical protein